VLFNSHLFLFAFLPLAYSGFYLLRKAPAQGAQLSWLLGASLVFYAWWNPRYIPLIVGSIVVNYCLGHLIGRSRNRLVLGTGIFLNIGCLLWFKYALFLATAIKLSPTIHHHVDQVVLPLAISFFTFQAMSYVIDVYRGNAEVQRKPVNIALYISLFPQLIAGPIVRYKDVAEQIVSRRVTHEGFAEGVRRFIIGLGKKMIIADTCARTVDMIFGVANDPAMQIGRAHV